MLDAEVMIVGTGFSGLCMAIQLQKSGMNSFLLLERGQDVGGTWRDNTYPGAACDIASHLYSLSFELNPNWTRVYPEQEEIQSYLKKVAEKYNLYSKIRFNSAVNAANFNDSDQAWAVVTDTATLKCRALVLGTGGLSEPVIPNIPGLKNFRGEVFHSAQWNHAHDLAGKHIAVIGTGASAVQFVPKIASVAGHIKVFQRTPPWVVPRNDRLFSAFEKFLFCFVPGAMRLWRWSIYWQKELLAVGMIMNPKLMTIVQKIGLKHIERQVVDTVLRDTVTPSDVIGCKRILLSDTWYPTISSPSVDLMTECIQHISAEGVVTSDGCVHAVDAIIFGTGFQASKFLSKLDIRGANGIVLNEVWRNGAEAYLGASVVGFPNLFLITGPNTGLGHNSMVFMIEANVQHILALVKQIYKQEQTSLEVKASVQQQFNQTIQAKLKKSVWSTGCKSWYQDLVTGKITTLWPGFSTQYWLRCRFFKQSDYTIRK
jgi:cation diffusion facilitator CzcD-associated flavoprotein CzcO